jgi:hypothetical protein
LKDCRSVHLQVSPVWGVAQCARPPISAPRNRPGSVEATGRRDPRYAASLAVDAIPVGDLASTVHD